MRNALKAFAVVVVLALGMTACGEKTPADHASDAADSAGKAIKGAAHDAGKAVQDATK